jgi:hypothetical protein
MVFNSFGWKADRKSWVEKLTGKWK